MSAALSTTEPGGSDGVGAGFADPEAGFWVLGAGALVADFLATALRGFAVHLCAPWPTPSTFFASRDDRSRRLSQTHLLRRHGRPGQPSRLLRPFPDRNARDRERLTHCPTERPYLARYVQTILAAITERHRCGTVRGGEACGHCFGNPGPPDSTDSPSGGLSSC